jgi:CRP-like cAMP-binding protein
MENLLNYLNAVYPMSEGLQDHLRKVVGFRTVKKREFLLKPGQRSRHMYFIASGLFRGYYYKDGDEVCSWFHRTGDVITSVVSFYLRQPAYEYIQALSDCMVFMIGDEDLDYIFRTYLEYNYIARVETERYYVKSEERLVALRRTKAEDRFEYLLEHHPWLLDTVPDKYVASYLDMSRRTMSRLRSKYKK